MCFWLFRLVFVEISNLIKWNSSIHQDQHRLFSTNFNWLLNQVEETYTHRLSQILVSFIGLVRSTCCSCGYVGMICPRVTLQSYYTIDVGASGCGKSTIVQLLERFYDVTKGRVVSVTIMTRYFEPHLASWWYRYSTTEYPMASCSSWSCGPRACFIWPDHCWEYHLWTRKCANGWDYQCSIESQHCWFHSSVAKGWMRSKVMQYLMSVFCVIIRAMKRQ